MATKKIAKEFSQTYLKEIERFKKQIKTLRQLETAYNIYAPKYYGKSKRRNLLGNQFDVVKMIDPYELKPTQLRSVIRSNVQAIRSLGFTSSMSDDYASALVLVQLNNEAFNATDWFAGSPNRFDNEWEAMAQQSEVFAEMLYQSLRNLRLTNYQLQRVLGQSILLKHHLDDVEQRLKDYWKSLRK